MERLSTTDLGIIKLETDQGVSYAFRPLNVIAGGPDDDYARANFVSKLVDAILAMPVTACEDPAVRDLTLQVQPHMTSAAALEERLFGSLAQGR